MSTLKQTTEAPVDTNVANLPSFEPGPARIYVKLRVEDPDELRKAATEQGIPDAASTKLESILLAFGVNPGPSAAASSFVLSADNSVVYLSKFDFQLCSAAEILDPKTFVGAARAAYSGCWGDDVWAPSNLGEALYELTLASNPFPCPLDLGFEIIEWSLTPFEA